MMVHPGCYVLTIECYHQMMAERARDKELAALHELSNNMLKERIERQEVLLALLDTQVASTAKLLELYQKQDEYDKLLSLSEN